MDHMPNMLNATFPECEVIKNLKCSKTKATEITKQCLAKEALDIIQQETQNNLFSIIIDETTDISAK